MSIEIGLNKEKIPLNPNHKLSDEIQERFNNVILSLRGNLYPPFKEWLNSKKEVTIEDALKDIHDNLFPHFKYDKTEDFLNSEISREYFFIWPAIILKNFYHYNDFNINTGECSELAYKLTLLVKEKYPALNIVICNGNDDNFFSKKEANHIFSVVYVSQGDNENFDNYFLDKPLPKIDKCSKHFYIVDPTYKKIAKLDDTNYKINGIVSFYDFDDEDGDERIMHGRLPVMIDEQTDSILGVEIIKNSDKRAVDYLKNDKGLGKKLALTHNETGIYNQAEIPDLERKFKDPKIRKFIKKFTDKLKNYKE